VVGGSLQDPEMREITRNIIRDLVEYKVDTVTVSLLIPPMEEDNRGVSLITKAGFPTVDDEMHPPTLHNLLTSRITMMQLLRNLGLNINNLRHTYSSNDGNHFWWITHGKAVAKKHVDKLHAHLKRFELRSPTGFNVNRDLQLSAVILDDDGEELWSYDKVRGERNYQ